MSNFEIWWEREGQKFLYALNTTTDDDIKLVAEIAWKNGAYCFEQTEQEPVAIDELARACNLAGIEYKDFLRIKAHLPIAAPVQQADQEPVAWFVQYKNRHEFVFGSKPEFIVDGVVEPLYAAPVRTKDLTDDEIMKINVDTAGIVPTCDRQFHFARAVIAADREKNK